jgi:glycosyltransferase involved in cell wall biosynthesis
MERALEKTRQSADIAEFINISNKDPRAEFEARILAGRIQTRDVAERILAAVKTIAPESTEEHRLTCIYPNDIRVHVMGPSLIHKVCVTKSFKDIPLNVERKTRYFESAGASRDTLDIADFFCRFSLKTEKHLKKDYDGTPEDPAAFIRVIHRQSFKVPGGEFRIDFSMVKTKKSQKEGLRDVLKNPPEYELEVEYTPRKDPRPSKEIQRVLYRILETVLGAYQETHHILPLSDLQKYAAEFKASGNLFYNPVTLERRHIVRDRPFNILSGYTVTNKADGQRCGLFVTRDRRVVRANPNGQVVFTGRVPHAEVQRYYDLVDVLAYPRHPMRLTELVTPLKPLEAMAQGRLMVASDVGGHRELIRHRETGWLFPAGQAQALVDALDQLLEQRALWPHLRASARHHAETERNWQVSARGYVPVFERLARR